MAFKSALVGAVALASVGLSTTAYATTIVDHYSLSATTSGPFTTHSGTFSLSYGKETPLFANLVSFDLKIGDRVFNETNVFFTSEASGNLEWFWRTDGLDILSFDTRNATFGYRADGQFHSGLAQFTLIKSTVLGAVPEPATWAMLVLGFGLTGGAMRRRVGAQMRIGHI